MYTLNKENQRQVAKPGGGDRQRTYWLELQVQNILQEHGYLI
jgi:hypothetical protein